jgi:hypothetical protein
VEVVPETRNGGRLVRPAPGHRSLATGTCHASPDEASGATWSREDKTLRREIRVLGVAGQHYEPACCSAMSPMTGNLNFWP